MALSIASYQSKTLINVSEDAHTPPSVDKSPAAGADDERVEDSLDEHRRTNAGGPVQSPRQPAEDCEEDDLYGLSPQGIASTAAASLAKKARIDSSVPQPSFIADSQWSQQRAVETALEEGATRSGWPELLINGATLRKSPTEKEPSRVACATDHALYATHLDVANAFQQTLEAVRLRGVVSSTSLTPTLLGNHQSGYSVRRSSLVLLSHTSIQTPHRIVRQWHRSALQPWTPFAPRKREWRWRGQAVKLSRHQGAARRPPVSPRTGLQRGYP